MCKLGVISQERLKIVVKLPLGANRQSFMPCRLIQLRMTLSDLGWHHGHRAASLPYLSSLLPWDGCLFVCFSLAGLRKKFFPFHEILRYMLMDYCCGKNPLHFEG